MRTEKCIALVTGGCSGLGEATVRLLAKSQAKVSSLDVAKEKGYGLTSELGSSVMFHNADVTSEEMVKSAISKTVKTFGGIHVAVNCAGVTTAGKVIGKQGPISLENFNRAIQINLIGTINVIRLTAQKMLDNIPNEDGERGVIINTSSGAAFEGQIGQSAYSASKAGIIGMTLPIAREFASYGIRIVTIAPGLFDTAMVASLPEKVRETLIRIVPFPRRLGKASEFAELVKHIIENPMLNGETIRLDGAVRMS